MEKICGIYKITSPSGKIYIGQSANIHKRFKEYKLLNCKQQPKLYNSFIKHGVENHFFEIIIQAPLTKLNQLEKHYVDLYKCFNSEHGLNLKDGGGSKGASSEETKRKQSESLKGEKNPFFGKRHSLESRQKMSKSLSGENSPNFGRKHSEETKLKMSEKAKGKFASEETKLKISIASKNRIISKESRKKQSESMKGKKQSLEQIKKRVKSSMETRNKNKQERLKHKFLEL